MFDYTPKVRPFKRKSHKNKQPVTELKDLEPTDDPHRGSLELPFVLNHAKDCAPFPKVVRGSKNILPRLWQKHKGKPFLPDSAFTKYRAKPDKDSTAKKRAKNKRYYNRLQERRAEDPEFNEKYVQSRRERVKQYNESPEAQERRRIADKERMPQRREARRKRAAADPDYYKKEYRKRKKREKK